MTHSLLFAALVAFVAVSIFFRCRAWGERRGQLWAYLTLVIVSHGVLDSLASYGEGVAFLAPFSWYRYSSPWHPVTGLLAEIVWLWIPAILGLLYWRRR